MTQLNERQRQAVLHGNGPLLVLAGAGSGKTSTMAHRIAHLVGRGASPASILGLSFTRKAAGELKERVQKLSGQRGFMITTFHSLCVRLLRENSETVGYPSNFSILDQSDSRDIVRQCLRDIRLDDRRFDPDRIGFEIGQAKNRFLGPDECEEFFLGSGRLPEDYGIAAASVYRRYQDQLKLRNAVDFDDLLFLGVGMLEKSPKLRAHYSRRFQHILVDEYQDTNPAQFRLLSHLTSEHRNLCVVGDDDQSIYAWRGADPAHILEFSKHFPEAVVITLDQNYRSTNSILEAANEVISKNRKRHPKKLWSARGEGRPLEFFVLEDDKDEAEFVAERILQLARGDGETAPHGSTRARPWRDFAILYRSNPQARVFEEALRMRRIPYKLVGSLSFLDRKEIKDSLSYWRVVVNPRDEASLRRIINWPARGIGKSAIEAVHEDAVAKGRAFYDSLREVGPGLPRAGKSISEFLALIDSLRAELSSASPHPAELAAWGKRSLDRIGVKKALFDEHADDPAQAERRWEIADELANSLGQLDPSDSPAARQKENGLSLLREFLTRMLLDEVDSDPEEEDPRDGTLRDEVTLLTLHGAKGLEYPVVFLVGMEDGLLPHQRSIDENADLSEERRLCYVGLTRARDQLLLTRASHRVRYGKRVPRNPSRFLADIPKHLVIEENRSSTPDLSSKELKEAHEAKVKDFLAGIRAQLRK